MKVRSSTKIALGFAALAAAAYGGYHIVTERMVMNERFPALAPGQVNLVGLAPGSGYSIVVANQMAQLVEASSDFEAGGTEAGGATEGSIKRRLPIKDMLNGMQGDKESLARFVMALNDMSENDETWPPERVVWTAERLRKALGGDKKEEAALVQALNVRLDGTPLPTLRISSLQNGIIIETPVEVQVGFGDQPRKIVCRIQEPYKPSLMQTVENAYKEKPNVDQTMQAGYYATFAREVLEGHRQRENVRAALEDRLSPKLARVRAEAPERVLKAAKVVVNESHIRNARYRSYSSNTGERLHDLIVELTDEGRRRLWQYSKPRVGSQLLLTVGGIPIVATRIGSELAQGELTITQMRDENLVREAVDLLKSSQGRAASR